MTLGSAPRVNDRPPLIANPWKRWAAGLAFWTLVALFFATRSGMQGEPADPAAVFQRSLVQWYLWGLFAAVIVRLDARLPVARENLPARALWHLPLSPLFTLAQLSATAAVVALLDGTKLGPDVFAAAWAAAGRGGLHWHILVYWLIAGGYFAFDYHARLQQRQVRNAELERLLAEARLENLRNQLHPHFVFNALNAVSAYVESDARKARRLLEQLGDLLRLSLRHADDQEIPLDEELAFLERYLALQQARFEERLRARVDAAPDARDALVPTFLLQPLVENAVRHGIAPRSSGGALHVEVSRQNGSLRLRVEDDGPGLPPGWTPEASAGVGLANTRERLRRLYGDGHRFSVSAAPDGGVRVEIEIPYRESASTNGHGADSNGHRR